MPKTKTINEQDLLRQVRQLQAARRKRAAHLRAKGYTLEQIGEELGISRQRVHAILKTNPN